jgi:hypothetical protein
VAADHVAHVLLGQFVVGQVQRLETVAREVGGDAVDSPLPWCRPTNTCACAASLMR